MVRDMINVHVSIKTSIITNFIAASFVYVDVIHFKAKLFTLVEPKRNKSLGTNLKR